MNDELKIEAIETNNGIGFKGSVSLSREEIEKRVDFLEEHSKEFNKLVIKAENELYIKELLRRNNQLQSNWNSLREIIKDLGIDYLLDKMNELEGEKDK